MPRFLDDDDRASYARVEAQADAIRHFWTTRGHAVRASVVRAPFLRGHNRRGWMVETDLRNGLPVTLPRVRPALARELARAV